VAARHRETAQQEGLTSPATASPIALDAFAWFACSCKSFIDNAPMSAVRPRGCTNFKTRQFARVLTRHYDQAMAACGLKTTQFSLLTRVLTLGPTPPGELARVMALDASTLTRNLQPLVNAGWLTQDAGRDARSRLVHLTPSGREKQAEAFQHWKLAQQSINRTLGVERVLALHALIDDCMALMQPSEAPAADQ
jgi:DNA-binding MarR family transcriptional regulator